ncbi:voltage-gated potassium channel [Nakamurella sp. UYEF19]|uniref:potassium channel family protein n=1 Tax=Nakamurella sp. UYEF19 TaxID=1756392 RepID=UPI00339335F7
MDQKRWATISDGPLMTAAIVFLAAYSWQVLGRPHPDVDDWLEIVEWITWAAFLIDYVMRLKLADPRAQWFWRHLLDLAAVALPILRPLRLLRLIALLSVFQRAAGNGLRGRVVTYAIGSTVVLVYIAALSVLEAERADPGATIRSFGDAVWWASATITTVGYGDLTPHTTTGRMIAVALMIGGIALLGTITATIASWLVQQVADKDEASQIASRAQVAELADRIQELTDLLAVDGRGAGLAPSGTGPPPG